VKTRAGLENALEKSVQGVEGTPGEEKESGVFGGSVETTVVGA
jgi:hypothetical protein